MQGVRRATPVWPRIKARPRHEQPIELRRIRGRHSVEIESRAEVFIAWEQVLHELHRMNSASSQLHASRRALPPQSSPWTALTWCLVSGTVTGVRTPCAGFPDATVSEFPGGRGGAAVGEYAGLLYDAAVKIAPVCASSANERRVCGAFSGPGCSLRHRASGYVEKVRADQRRRHRAGPGTKGPGEGARARPRGQGAARRRDGPGGVTPRRAGCPACAGHGPCRGAL